MKYLSLIFCLLVSTSSFSQIDRNSTFSSVERDLRNSVYLEVRGAIEAQGGYTINYVRSFPITKRTGIRAGIGVGPDGYANDGRAAGNVIMYPITTKYYFKFARKQTLEAGLISNYYRYETQVDGPPWNEKIWYWTMNATAGYLVTLGKYWDFGIYYTPFIIGYEDFRPTWKGGAIRLGYNW